MSLQFSNTTTKAGIIQLIERNLGFNDGDISGNATLLAQFTGDINLAIDEVFGFMFPLGGTWQLDDTNHTDYPFIYTDLVSGQRDYSFLTDARGNTILDIYRVMVANSSGQYQEILPVDQETLDSNNSDTDSFIDGQNLGGAPTRYDKTANGIFLDPIPNYNYTNGLKVFINREGSYFSTTDTTKKVGFASLFHEYFALRPSYQYAYRKSLANAVALEKEVLRMKEAIKMYYGKREKDVKGRLSANIESTK